MKKHRILLSIYCLVTMGACQNRIVDSGPQLGTEKNELMKRVEIARVQIKANEDIVDVFSKVRRGIRQVGSLFSTDSSTYTPFDAVKNIFESFGGGIPELKEKNEYVLEKDIKIPLAFGDCKDFKVYAKLLDEKIDEKSLSIEGQELTYAIQGCNFKEKTKLLSLSWLKSGISFEVESSTLRKLTNPKNYKEDFSSSLTNSLEELSENTTCRTKGKVFDTFEFICENIVIIVYEKKNEVYAHTVLLEKISYNSEKYIMFEAEGVNIVRDDVTEWNDAKGGVATHFSKIVKEQIFVKIFEDGKVEHELKPFIDAIEKNPETQGLIDEVDEGIQTVKDSVDEVLVPLKRTSDD